jgi:hypothetical protein
MNKEQLIKEWADFYKESVKNEWSPEPEIETDEAGYREFGEWMIAYFEAYPDYEFIEPSGTEDRTFYRAYALAKHIVEFKLKPGLDDDIMATYLLTWYKAGLVDKETIMSVIFYSDQEDYWNGEKWVK